MTSLNMRFHLVDRVDSWQPMRRVEARKLTSVAEPHWTPDAGGGVMPPALVLEALCQAGTWLLMLSTDYRSRAALLSVGEVEFVDDVRPGDELRMVGVIDSATDAAAVLSGEVSVGARTVLRASHIMCALLDAATLEDPEATRRMGRLLTRAEAA